MADRGARAAAGQGRADRVSGRRVGVRLRTPGRGIPLGLRHGCRVRASGNRLHPRRRISLRTSRRRAAARGEKAGSAQRLERAQELSSMIPTKSL
jgi:hypothetical protein